MSAQANTGTVLDRILESRRAEVEHRKKVLPETALKYGVKAATPLRNFCAALERDALLGELLVLGRELGMEALVEVHTREELARALAAGARILGVNNRDLKTLATRVETSFELIGLVPEDCIAVSESGLRTHDDLLKLRAAGFDAFLIGTHLMASPDPAAALSALLGSAPKKGPKKE